ncbi:MAG: hypothetical protein HZA19_03190, partial [Nitrospirae bacterium]|nr:hypothetical protein [Nitrospirota bacterium]
MMKSVRKSVVLPIKETEKNMGRVIKHHGFILWAVLVIMLTAGSLPAQADQTFVLRATAGYITAGDGSDIYMWSFADYTTGLFRYPGPLLEVNEGETVTVYLFNSLPDPDGFGPLNPDPVSLVFPGQEGVTHQTSAGWVPQSPVYETIGDKSTLRSLDAEAMAGGGGYVVYRFQAAKPGTYYYQSGTYLHKHIDMGLFGGLIVHPTTPKQAYATPDTAYDRENFLMMSA